MSVYVCDNHVNNDLNGVSKLDSCESKKIIIIIIIHVSFKLQTD